MRRREIVPMAKSPYRTPARSAEEPPRETVPVFGDITGIALFVWIATLLRVGGALLVSEPASRELDLAWLVLFLAPVAIWKDIASRRRARTQ